MKIPTFVDIAMKIPWVFPLEMIEKLMMVFFHRNRTVSCDRKRLVILVGGIPSPLKMIDFVSWDDEIPDIWKVIIQTYIQSCSSHHQPAFMLDLKEFPVPPAVASPAALAEFSNRGCFTVPTETLVLRCFSMFISQEKKNTTSSPTGDVNQELEE